MPATLTGFRDYAIRLGYTVPQLTTDADAQAAIERGRDYILAEYVSGFSDEYDDTAPNVEVAIYEAALGEIDDTGALHAGSFWTNVYTPGERKALVGVDTLRWEVLEGGDGRCYPVSSRIEALLRRYRTPSGPRWLLRA